MRKKGAPEDILRARSLYTDPSLVYPVPTVVVKDTRHRKLIAV